ncbi:MAG TPA: dephospho-CoA kinase [Clostridia bacterium]|jgi:dephospho-CoA kinase|nr:MAG: Dephospho-CoA kinase [Firmicutes bacterium ADurb.Bin146]HOD93582.1 dephospho-CoA kinase [Clostridia bacterium]
MIIGITGQIATGKSSLAQAFFENGFKVFDADKTYNHLLSSDTMMREEILFIFGTLDRKLLLNNVLANTELLTKLNSITHKYVITQMHKFLKENMNNNIVLDVPIPVRKGFLDLTDIKIVTCTNQDNQINRLKNRYGVNEAQAKKRIEMQMKMIDYINIGDIILNTDNTDNEDLIKFVKIFKNTYMKGN